MNGTGLEVTVLQCSRLNTKLFHPDHVEIFCTVSLGKLNFFYDKINYYFI